MTSADTSDGRFYADGKQVFRSSRKTKTERGHCYSLGFPVCTTSQYVSDDVAGIIATALNKMIDSGEMT